MIRLPPTSISLSESDIQLHLREISIYQSLLQQGFTREAIQRYYASMRVTALEGHPSLQDPQLARTPGWSSDEESSVTHDDRPARSRNPDQHSPWPVFPPEASGEMAKIALQTRQMRIHQAPQAAPRIAEHLKLASRRYVGFPKQTAYVEAIGEAGYADRDTGIVVISNSRDTGSFAPSTVELRARPRVDSECFPPLFQNPSDDYGDQTSQPAQGYPQLREQRNHREDASDSHSPPLASNMNLSIRHRPRQSSMLHITRNAASPNSSRNSDDSFKSTVTKMPPTNTLEVERSPRTRTTTYRQRSQTYPWVESEADDPKAVLQPGTTIITSHHQISSPTSLRAEAEDFVPLKLPSPFSATRRISSGQHSLPSSIRNTSPSILQHEMHARSFPNLAVSTPPRSSSIGSVTRHLGASFASSPDREFPSSPPTFGDSKRSPESSPKKRTPTTPNHRRCETAGETQTRALPKTPRVQARMQQNDGPGTVYDDRVPAFLQPKTPADLTRGTYVTDRDAAYTAPPGRTARTPATIIQALLSPTRRVDPGEESPSRRARTLRERRERELRRSAIMEEEIWERLRELEGDTVGGRMHWDGPGPGLITSWRDDFDADRLGEENFDEEGFTRTPRLEARVQGSARATRRRGP